jgi:hypothetical protein
LKRILMGRGGEGRVEKKDGGGFINSGLTVPPVWLKKGDVECFTVYVFTRSTPYKMAKNGI